MKFTRSSKCSLKFATKAKQLILRDLLGEYGKIVNQFINHFWDLPKLPSKGQLLKPIVDIPTDTWLSARLRKVAAREALDMILAARRRWHDKAAKPTHRGKRMVVSSTIARLEASKDTTEFDAWLLLRSVGDKVRLDLPIQFHKHYNRLSARGKRLEAYVITDHDVQFAFKIETGVKRTTGINLGVDTGILALASLSDGR